MLKRERTNFFSLGGPERSPKKVKKGTARRGEGCCPDGTRSPSRCRASRCNAKLKQNYLVPLSYGTRYGAEAPRRWGWLSPLGRHSSLLGVHFNANKKRLLKAIFSSEKESGRDGCMFVCAMCRYARESGTGCFVCRRSEGGLRIYWFMTRAQMRIDLCNSKIPRSHFLAREKRSLR